VRTKINLSAVLAIAALLATLLADGTAWP